LKGQWIGTTTGDTEGQIIVNVDDRGSYYSGKAHLIPDNASLLASSAFFNTKDKNNKFNFNANIYPIDPRTGENCKWEQIPKSYLTGQYSKKAEVEGCFDDHTLEIKAKTDIELAIQAKIIKKPYSEKSELTSVTKKWDEYKEYVATLSGKKQLFRGQKKQWKLRTAFHRKGRYDISRLINDDIPRLQQYLSARTRHVFNLEILNERGAFYNLVQHHGYPTPLLDWTYSPYVAAFFAFRNVQKIEKDGFVRIFIFDKEKWASEWNQVFNLDAACLHVSVIEFLAIENERLIPQQSATTITNVDDIESYIKAKEDKANCKYLTAIDISYKERNKIMEELGFMGITAGSMFPGLDGACEELREKFFDV
jgi:hypothetical protein